MSGDKQKPMNSQDNTDKMEYASGISHIAICCEEHTTKNDNLPMITISPTDGDVVAKRYSTGSDYTEWGNRLSKQDNDMGKFFDGMGLDRGVLEPMLSIQYANIHPTSSSSLNLLESASNAGCILDTDQDNCDKRSDLGLPSFETMCAEGGSLKACQPTPEETNSRIMQWLTHVSPTNNSQDETS